MSRRDQIKAEYDQKRKKLGIGQSKTHANHGESSANRQRFSGLVSWVWKIILLFALAGGLFAAMYLRDRTPDGAYGHLQIAGTGSGFFICETGWFVTAAHVVADARHVELISKRDSFPAFVVRMDVANDVALLKADGQFSALRVRDSDAVRMGEAVMTIGFPMPGIQGQNPKLTRGDVSSIAGVMDDPRHYQISVPVQPGNSGGPLCCMEGQVIGVIVSRLSEAGVFRATGTLPQNVNYALKSSYLKPLLAPEPGFANLRHSAVLQPLPAVELVESAVALVVAYK